MNKFIGLGLLGGDPEEISNGCKFSIAIRGFNGTEKTITWIKVLVFGKAGSNCKEILTKGRRVLVEGRLDRQISNQELVIISDNIQFL